MNRLDVVESLSSTGGMADHRFAMRRRTLFGCRRNPRRDARRTQPTAPPWLPALVRDLRGHVGPSLVLAAEFLTDSVFYNSTRRGSHPLRHAHSPQLAKEILSGVIGAVFLLDCNPVYTAPADVPFAEALRKVPFSVHHGLYADETAAVCRWHLPDLHALESWGDAVAFEERQAYIQPLIQPLYDGISRYVLAAAPKSRS